MAECSWHRGHLLLQLTIVVTTFVLHVARARSAQSADGCVTTCAGRRDGDFPSCHGCHVFVMCIDGRLYDDVACPPGLKFDPKKKRCSKISTCRAGHSSGDLQAPSTGPRNPADRRDMPLILLGVDGDESSMPAGNPGGECVRDCHDLPDGNYQSCLACNIYASCRQGTIIDGRLCSAGTSWDDKIKKCVRSSTTCPISTKNGPRTVPVGACVLECKGLADGQYQSCRGCEYFVNCWDGELVEERLCHPTGTDLLWDDNVKLCLPSSSTCSPGTSAPKVTTENAPSRHVPLGTCVASCENIADGNYQSCHGCHVFVTCKNEVIFDNRACEQSTVWDDRIKQCSMTSSTCGTSHSSCVTSCEGITAGKYQSCRGCHLYITCDATGNLQTSACDDNLVWDDDLKVCVRTSSTCNYGERKETPPDVTGSVTVVKGTVVVTDVTKEQLMSTVTSEPHVTDVDRAFPVTTDAVPVTQTDQKNGSIVAPQTSCITSCENLPDGNYQSCFGCHMYSFCSGGRLYPRSCPRNLGWDESVKRCRSNSTTCGPGFGGCVRDCGPLQDGDYQSCRGCRVHVTCFNRAIRDNRPCPKGLVWDDLVKWCVKTSTTCREPTTRSPCVTSCRGLADGDYQSCKGCGVYVTCSNANLLDRRSCPNGLKFDGTKKRCVKRSSTCGAGRGECVTSCGDLPDGNYKSCVGCSVYVTCTSGVLSDNQPCPDRLQWDDVLKRCVTKSATCDVDDDADVNVTSSGDAVNGDADLATLGSEQWNFTYEGHVGDGKCVSSCEGKLNGDYQSCLGCNVFAACLNGILYNKRPCPDGLVWEDTIKHCMSTSSTCSPGRGGCVSSCVNLPDGDYQSCLGCHVYASCQGGLLKDERPCPRREVWDDQRKRCEHTSVTCPKEDGRAVPAGVCVHSCEGRPDGDYQSCLGCTGYVTCTNGSSIRGKLCSGERKSKLRGIIHDNRPCPTGLVWDDSKRRCRYTSPTCRPGRGMCTRTCDALPDGDYQSCLGCRVYATCLVGEMHDGRPCPGGLVWDDSVKRCMRSSPTCGGAARQQTGGDPVMELARLSGSRVQAVTSQGCVTSCEGVEDGDYQSCHDCRVYVTCRMGVASDDRPCPGRTVWDDALKRCMQTSRTCSSIIVFGGGGGGGGVVNRPRFGHTASRHPGHGGRTLADPARSVGPGSNCIRSCDGRDNGDYQSCLDCRVYATCLFGTLHDNRPCPRHTLWDDIKKRCMYDSPTCHLPGHRPRHPRRQSVHQTAWRTAQRVSSSRQRQVALPRPLSCVSSCESLTDGEYQSCHDCRLYASCRDGVLNDYRPCPVNTYWDDRQKRCLRSSSTCTGYRPETPSPQRRHSHNRQAPRQVAPRGCVTSCRGIPDGDYQSCQGCSGYVSCIRGNFFSGRHCPQGLLWDDTRKRCDYTSGSCSAASRRARPQRCVSSCVGMEDGDYQSCTGCHAFATCKGGVLQDGRPCPGKTLWEDNLKRCLWVSITCRE